MVVIDRAGPWDDHSTLRIPKADEIRPRQIRISATSAERKPSPELVGAGSRR